MDLNSITGSLLAGRGCSCLCDLLYKRRGYPLETKGSPLSAVIANLCMEIFEGQAIEFAPCKPKIWKRFVDDTFTIQDRDRVDVYLQHLNSQQSSIIINNQQLLSTILIRESENDSKIAFLDTSVYSETDGRLSLPLVSTVSQHILIST